MFVSIKCNDDNINIVNSNINNNHISISLSNTNLYDVVRYLNTVYNLEIYVNLSNNITISNININNRSLKYVLNILKKLCNIDYCIINHAIYINNKNSIYKEYILDFHINNDIYNNIVLYANTRINTNIYKYNNIIGISCTEENHVLFHNYISSIKSNYNKQIEISIKVVCVSTSENNISALDQIVENVFGALANNNINLKTNTNNHYRNNNESSFQKIYNAANGAISKHKYSGNIEINLESTSILFLKNMENGIMTSTWKDDNDSSSGFNLKITPNIFNDNINLAIMYEHSNNINNKNSDINHITTNINIMPNNKYIIGSQTVKCKVNNVSYFINIPIIKSLLFFLNKTYKTTKIKQYFVILEAKVIN